MANEYIKLICQLRDSAKLEQATCEADGIEISGHVEMLRAAAELAAYNTDECEISSCRYSASGLVSSARSMSSSVSVILAPG